MICDFSSFSLFHFHDDFGIYFDQFPFGVFIREPEKVLTVEIIFQQLLFY